MTLNELHGTSTPEGVKAGGAIKLQLQQLVCCQEQESTVAFFFIRVRVGAGLVEVGECERLVMQQMQFTICTAKHAAEMGWHS